MAVATRSLGRRPGPSRILFAVSLAIVIALGAVSGAWLSAALLGPRGDGPGGPPVSPPTVSPTPTPTPSPSPSPTPSPTPSPVPTPSPTPVPTPVPTPPPTVAPTQVPPSGPPACRYDDILTKHRDYGAWRITLLDTIYMLPSTYAPGDLVDTSVAGLNGGYPIRSFLVGDLSALVRDARAGGVNLAVVSGYRSHAQQVTTFQYWVDTVGYEQALRTSARAGHSEHQLGTTLDFSTAGGGKPWDYADWATTREGAWMAANAWRYGFVMSYPRGAFAQTCYDYEPWHYRYVGRELAAIIHDGGRTPRQVIWDLQ